LEWELLRTKTNDDRANGSDSSSRRLWNKHILEWKLLRT
jgi:hypothetical protein